MGLYLKGPLRISSFQTTYALATLDHCTNTGPVCIGTLEILQRSIKICDSIVIRDATNQF